MHVVIFGCLIGVILICLAGVLVEFATRPLRTTLSREIAAFDCEFPFWRLLDCSDFNYLKRSGFSSAELTKIREHRRRIARQWLRGLAAEFNRVTHAASMLLIDSGVDRADLASLLARQRAVFCWYFIRAEARLTLHACGLYSQRPLASFDPFRELCRQVRELSEQLQVAGLAV